MDKNTRYKADIVFEFYYELKQAYKLALKPTNIFNMKYAKDVIKTKPSG